MYSVVKFVALLAIGLAALLSVVFVVSGNPKKHNLPPTAFAYAKMVEPILGVPPRVDLSKGVETPLYVDGHKVVVRGGYSCENPSRLGRRICSSLSLTADIDLFRAEIGWRC